MKQVEFDFVNSRYIVTGASSGIGRQVVKDLVAAGAMVLAIARRQDQLICLQKELKRVEIAALDVCNQEDMERAIAKFVQQYGKLDGSIHAAGISGITPLRAYDVDLAAQIMEVSFWAGIKLVQIATKSQYANKGTSNIWISSVAAVSAPKGMFAYSAAKAAVNSAVQVLAKEICKKGHRINSIMPGWVKSPMTDELGKVSNLTSVMEHQLLGIGKATDVSGMILFLLSDKAQWITGTNLSVDGGSLA